MGPVESSRTWEATSCIFYIPQKKALNICGYPEIFSLSRALENSGKLFRAAKAFRVTRCKRRCDVSRPFASDTSPNWIDREGLGKRRRGNRQGNLYICSSEQLFTSKNKVVGYPYPQTRFIRRKIKGRGGEGGGGGSGTKKGKGDSHWTADRWTV